jgi:hypothetical protein
MTASINCLTTTTTTTARRLARCHMADLASTVETRSAFG